MAWSTGTGPHTRDATIGLAEEGPSPHDAKECPRLLTAKGRRYQLRLSPITHRMSSAPTGQDSIVFYSLSSVRILFHVSALRLSFCFCHGSRNIEGGKTIGLGGAGYCGLSCMCHSHCGQAVGGFVFCSVCFFRFVSTQTSAIRRAHFRAELGSDEGASAGLLLTRSY